MSDANPRVIFLFSGKRKSGKDYITDKLKERLGDKSVILRLAGPIKKEFAESKGLNFSELLNPTAYKEKFRKEMVAWSEKMKETDIAYFVKAAIKLYKADDYTVWIVSDMRRESDLELFLLSYESRAKIWTVRIKAPDSVRQERGWVYTDGIDNAATECGLDNISHWDLLIDNDGKQDVEEVITRMVNLCTAYCPEST